MAAKVRYFIVLSKQGKEGRGGVPLWRCQRQRIGQDTTPAWIGSWGDGEMGSRFAPRLPFSQTLSLHSANRRSIDSL